MKSLLVNGRFLTQRLTGVQRFGREMLRELARIESGGDRKGDGDGDLDGAVDGETSLQALVPPGSAAGLELPVGTEVTESGWGRGHLWEQAHLARVAPDRMLLNLCNTAPIARHRQAVVLHDASVAANPAAYSRKFRAWYGVMLRGYLRSARHLITVSKFSASEIARHYGIAIGRINVVGESGEHVLRTPADPSILGRLGVEPDGYVLAVSSNTPNKNFGLIEKASRQIARPGFKLVVAGPDTSARFASTDRLGLDVVHAGYVSDAALRALYENAACFVFPSFYEGFGLPPLEAMSCACPVIASDTSSIPEVCGDAAVYCNPRDPESLSGALDRLLSSRPLRDEMRERGRAHAASHSWAGAARSLHAILQT